MTEHRHEYCAACEHHDELMLRLEILEANQLYYLSVVEQNLQAVAVHVEAIEEEEAASNEEAESEGESEHESEHEEGEEDSEEAGNDDEEVVIDDDTALPPLPTDEADKGASHALPMMG